MIHEEMMVTIFHISISFFIGSIFLLFIVIFSPCIISQFYEYYAEFLFCQYGIMRIFQTTTMNKIYSYTVPPFTINRIRYDVSLWGHLLVGYPLE